LISDSFGELRSAGDVSLCEYTPIVRPCAIPNIVRLSCDSHGVDPPRPYRVRLVADDPPIDGRGMRARPPLSRRFSPMAGSAIAQASGLSKQTGEVMMISTTLIKTAFSVMAICILGQLALGAAPLVDID
jgi:hypothetical protein